MKKISIKKIAVLTTINIIMTIHSSCTNNISPYEVFDTKLNGKYNPHDWEMKAISGAIEASLVADKWHGHIDF